MRHKQHTKKDKKLAIRPTVLKQIEYSRQKADKIYDKQLADTNDKKWNRAKITVRNADLREMDWTGHPKLAAGRTQPAQADLLSNDGKPIIDLLWENGTFQWLQPRLENSNKAPQTTDFTAHAPDAGPYDYEMAWSTHGRSMQT